MNSFATPSPFRFDFEDDNNDMRFDNVDDDDMRTVDVEPGFVKAVIYNTKEELADLTRLMTDVLGEWRYSNLKDVMSMRALLTEKHKNVHESFMPVMDRTWNLLRRLTNLYNRYQSKIV